MADGDRALKQPHLVVVEPFRYEAHRTTHSRVTMVVDRDDTGRLLSAMLQ